MARLNIGNPPCQPYSPLAAKISGRTYKLESGHFTPFSGNFMTGAGPDDIASFGLDFDAYGCIWRLETRSGRKEALRVSTQGTRFTNFVGPLDRTTSLYRCDGWWPEDNVFELHGRWVETCLEDVYRLTFSPDGKVEITAKNNSPFRWGEPEPIVAVEAGQR